MAPAAKLNVETGGAPEQPGSGFACRRFSDFFAVSKKVQKKVQKPVDICFGYGIFFVLIAGFHRLDG